MGAELLEVATPPNPSSALSPGGPTHEQVFLLRKWEAASTPHSHRCKHRPGDPALAEDVPDLCPRKVVAKREPGERDHPARPRWSTEDQRPRCHPASTPPTNPNRARPRPCGTHVSPVRSLTPIASSSPHARAIPAASCRLHPAPAHACQLHLGQQLRPLHSRSPPPSSRCHVCQSMRTRLGEAAQSGACREL